ncbi:MAG: beta-N-acetylhexosaminidase [Oscillospiraceae bacterium]|jgi:hexosaminidase|nr:beta-N-acetylhexosaminidase [Oscillospiraceae bacterium]
MEHTLLPLPNGRTEFTGETLPLPRELRAARADFAAGPLEVFAQRAGVALTEDGPPLLRLYRNQDFPAEGYRLRVTRARGIQVEAATEQGLGWALVTLYSLMDGCDIPCCDIADQPKYKYRGILPDCVRHFFPVATVKRFIDALSMVKVNTLHWHLTNDQGWRIESKLFPRLHENNAPEYYTQEEIRDIVAFAGARGVEIVPEVDLPGHTTSILSVWPELGCAGRKVRLGDAPGIYSVILCPGKEAVFELLFPLLEEVAGLFPSPLFHLGGDEAPKPEWRACPDCQRRMARECLASEEELQGWFTARLAAHLRGLGKRPVCWNESLLSTHLRNAAPDLVAQYWAEMHTEGPSRRFWESGGAMIFSDYLRVYLDQPHGSDPLRTVYAYAPGLPFYTPKEPLPAFGMEACVWTEYIATPEKLAKMTFPRAYALAEAAWTAPARKDYGDFRRRLDAFLARFPGMGFTPPELCDPRGLERYRERAAFMKMQATAPRPENNGGAGGAIAPSYLLRWIKFFLG